MEEEGEEALLPIRPSHQGMRLRPVIRGTQVGSVCCSESQGWLPGFTRLARSSRQSCKAASGPRKACHPAPESLQQEYAP